MINGMGTDSGADRGYAAATWLRRRYRPAVHAATTAADGATDAQRTAELHDPAGSADPAPATDPRIQQQISRASQPDRPDTGLETSRRRYCRRHSTSGRDLEESWGLLRRHDLGWAQQAESLQRPELKDSLRRAGERGRAHVWRPLPVSSPLGAARAGCATRQIGEYNAQRKAGPRNSGRPTADGQVDQRDRDLNFPPTAGIRADRAGWQEADDGQRRSSGSIARSRAWR
jgi:hypothetical protein